MPDEQIKNLLKVTLGRDATEAELTAYKTESAKLTAPPAPAPPAPAPASPKEITLPGIVQSNPNPELMKEIASLKALFEAERTQREAEKKAFEEKQKTERDKKVADKIALAKKLGRIPAENKEAEARLKSLLDANFDATVETLSINEDASSNTTTGNGNNNSGSGGGENRVSATQNRSELRAAAENAFKADSTAKI